jgi:hypothetical protein
VHDHLMHFDWGGSYRSHPFMVASRRICSRFLESATCHSELPCSCSNHCPMILQSSSMGPASSRNPDLIPNPGTSFCWFDMPRPLMVGSQQYSH